MHCICLFTLPSALLDEFIKYAKARNFFYSELALFFPQHLIDLAGSESSKIETNGLRRKEGSYINKSLLTLGTVSGFFAL